MARGGLVHLLFGGHAFARAAITPAAAMPPTTTFGFFASLHRRTRLARLLIPARFPRLPRLTRFARRACLLVATLLVHVAAGTLAVRAAIAALACGRTIGAWLARRTLATRRALLAALLLRPVIACALALAIPAAPIAVTPIASASTFAAIAPFVTLLVAARTGLRPRLCCGW